MFSSMLSVLVLSGSAQAAADLTTGITLPASATVDTQATYTVRVNNIGNRDASNVTVSIQLPVTHTSPGVYVMGVLGTRSASCVQSGTKLNCAIGTLRKARSSTVTFNIALPQSSAPLTFAVTATTTSAENSTANNGSSATAALTYIDIPLAGDYTVTNDHCTGTNLTAWYECTLFPSSISSHTVEFHADGTLSIPVDAGYYGWWGQDSDDHLWFEYWYGGAMEVSFEGNGTTNGCFDGLTLFNGSAYVAPYEVCF